MSTSVAGSPDPGLLQEALDAAVRGIAALVSVDDVLQVIVDRVRPLLAAEYAALGFVDDRGHIERFITSGMDDDTRRAIGALQLIAVRRQRQVPREDLVLRQPMLEP